MEKEIICGIYKITSPTGKIYIGQSVKIKYRFSKYKRLNCEEQVKLYRSFKKHGVENHIFEIVEECSEEDLNCRERFWQDFYDVLNSGLNCILTECSSKRREFSEEWRKTHSEKMTGRVQSEETKNKRRGENNYMYGKIGVLSPNYGSKRTQETKDRMIEKLKNRYLENINPLLGVPLSKEHRDKISQANKGKMVTNEAKQNMSKNHARPSAKKVFDTHTYTIYNSVVEAANIFNIKSTTLGGYLNGKRKNKTSLVFYVPELHDHLIQK